MKDLHEKEYAIIIGVIVGLLLVFSYIPDYTILFNT